MRATVVLTMAVLGLLLLLLQLLSSRTFARCAYAG